MLSQSTIALGPDALARATAAAAGGEPARLLGSTPTTSQTAVDAGELDLVGADEAGTDEVDEVPSRQVRGEQQLAWPPLETGRG